MPDQLHRFHFKSAPVRGVWVRLETAWRDICANQDYPTIVKNTLGEMLAAVAVISNNIKLDGAVALQSIGDGPLSMTLAECRDRRWLRGIARENEDKPGSITDALSFRELIGQGRLAISLLPDEGDPYQGLIEMTEPDLARNMENYFAASEQLQSRLRLAVSDAGVVGCLLQRLPDDDLATEIEIEQNEDDWRRVGLIFDPLHHEELAELSVSTLLRRLFHADLIQLADGQPIEFHCPCTAERSENALRMMSAGELDEILTEDGVVAVVCEFCGAKYPFDALQVHRVKSGQDATLH